MAKRVKPILNIPTVHDLNEADAFLAKIKARERELALLGIQLKEDIDALKLKCAEAAAPIQEELDILHQALVRSAKRTRKRSSAKSAPSR